MNHPMERDERTGKSAAAQRMQRQSEWVDQQIRVAMERGDFDNLPGAGKPLKDLGRDKNDPDWWLKKLVEREQLTGLLPPALGLRKETLELDGRLDKETSEAEVRRILDDFNRRVVNARRQLNGGPPVITPTRDVDAEVLAWRERRAERIERQREAARSTAARPSSTDDSTNAGRATSKRRRWFPRGR